MVNRLELALGGHELSRVAPVEAAFILGSGLSAFSDAVDAEYSAEFAELPEYPGAGEVAGHAGTLVIGTLAGKRVAAFAGRVHRYQGLSALQAAWPARLAAALGTTTLVVTNAAGGVSDAVATGGLVLITDHINLTGDSPLVGWPGPPGGTPFVPLHDAYDPALVATALVAASELDISLVPGVYAGLLGPNYETPAEVRYLRRIGADVVGMSTVPEVIVARAFGMRVLGISLVTNIAADAEISHAEVLERGRQAGEDLLRLLPAILERL
ncbi:MAG: purine-nucleoside phosphorylase [Coriobacteriia bacterium]|jgi:purine-nucleoside phosphorylase|nr:purine-nucleoside phosphorylase [Coriobacteriia bacterium]